uniref:Integrase catalytic domain-containing protein n=1 Tax=Cajanus cajan TaxID=3821 RepID=A0A151U085_CAJCA|nr:hypothetical protein KK1_005300 [Cajanus cajan]
MQRVPAIWQRTPITPRSPSPHDVSVTFLLVGNGHPRAIPPAKGHLKFLLVAIDYFTKWIEACPLAKITTENVRKFTWKNIVCSQAEAANKVILRELKKRLGNAKGQWPDMLPCILWAYHYTPQSTT